MLKESLDMAEMDAAMNPEMAKHFENHEKPLISYLAATDWDREHKAVEKFDSVHFANEWDGVVAFTRTFDGNDEIDIFEEMKRRAAPIQLANKKYPNVLDVAKLKYPDLDWDQISTMPTKVYIAKKTEVEHALSRGPARVRAINR